MTSCPSFRSLSQRCEPMKPAPPVTSIRIFSPAALFVVLRRTALYQPSADRAFFFVSTRGRVGLVGVRALTMMAASASASRLVRLLDATIDGRERGEDEEEQGVCRRVKREVEEAVDEHARAARQSAQGDSASHAVVRLHALESRSEEGDEENDAERAADHTGVGERLQVIVVRLLKPVVPVRGVVARVDGAERAEAGAEDGVVSDYLNRAL